MLISSFFEVLFADYFQLTLITLFFLSVLAGLLSPLIVFSRRSFVPDALGHLVFPGIALGILAAEFFKVDKWILVSVSCFLTGILGLKWQFFLEQKLKVGADAATIVLLGFFFAFGIILSKITNTEFDLHSILFGDPLGVQGSQVALLIIVTALIFAAMLHLKNDISAWLCDKEFAQVSGYRVKQVEQFFTVAVTAAVLTGIWSVGTLMMTAFLTLPQVISHAPRILHPRTFLVSIALSCVGVICSIVWNLPIGAACVFFGGAVVIAQSIFARK